MDDEERQSGSDSTPESAAVVFAVLWSELADVLGTAATATLLRRALKRAAVSAPELAGLEIVRERFEYRYTVPAGWKDEPIPSAPLRTLVAELRPLLAELTGAVMVRRLDTHPSLRWCSVPQEGGEG